MHTQILSWLPSAHCKADSSLAPFASSISLKLVKSVHLWHIVRSSTSAERWSVHHPRVLHPSALRLIMAEVLGVVASGIAVEQLAGYVASSVIKPKGYWDEVKDAPDQIRHLLLEIDSLNLILSHIGDDISKSILNLEELYIEQSVKLCREGTEELNDLVEEGAQEEIWKCEGGSVEG
jgi:hypothetical protein